MLAFQRGSREAFTELFQRYREAIYGFFRRRLDGEAREILLREYEQLSYAEIADLLCIPVNTVRSRLFRARMALRDLLASRQGAA